VLSYDPIPLERKLAAHAAVRGRWLLLNIEHTWKVVDNLLCSHYNVTKTMSFSVGIAWVETRQQYTRLHFDRFTGAAFNTFMCLISRGWVSGCRMFSCKACEGFLSNCSAAFWVVRYAIEQHITSRLILES